MNNLSVNFTALGAPELYQKKVALSRVFGFVRSEKKSAIPGFKNIPGTAPKTEENRPRLVSRRA
jgi:hypothetical protein